MSLAKQRSLEKKNHVICFAPDDAVKFWFLEFVCEIHEFSFARASLNGLQTL